MVLELAWTSKSQSPQQPPPRDGTSRATRRQSAIEEHAQHLQRQIEERRRQEHASDENKALDQSLATQFSKVTVHSRTASKADSDGDHPMKDAAALNASAFAANNAASSPVPLADISQKALNHSSGNKCTVPEGTKTTTAPQTLSTAPPPTQSALAASKYAGTSQPDPPKKIPQNFGLYVPGDPKLFNRTFENSRVQLSSSSGLRRRAPPQEDGVRYKGRGFAKSNASSSIHSAPSPKQNNQSAHMPSPARDRGQRNTSAPPPLPASAVPLKGEALIREQNRRALQAHGGAARATNASNSTPAAARTPAPTTAGNQIRGLARASAQPAEENRHTVQLHPGRVRTSASSTAAQQPIARPARPQPTGIAANDRRFDGLSGPSLITLEHIKLQRSSEPEVPTKTMSDHVASFTHGKFNPDEDQRHIVYFDKWAPAEKRAGAPADVRRVILTNVPGSATARDVGCMIWGGDVEEINFKEGENRASVLFTHPRSCARYLEDTANGIEYKNRSIWVESSKEVEPLVGTRRQMIEFGVSRVVHASNVPMEILPGPMHKLGRDTGALEHFTVAFPGGRKDATWRFCNLDAASNFKSALSRDDRFNQPPTVVSFGNDPCRGANGVHD